MKFVNMDFPASREKVLEMLKDNERVNKNVRFDDYRGKPHMKIKEKNNGKIKNGLHIYVRFQ